MRHLFAHSLIAATLFSSACASPRRRAEEQRLEWRAAAPRVYSFEYQRQCFCLDNMIWWRVEVRDGRVIAAVLVNPQDSVLSAASTPVAEHPTIDGIFVELRRVLQIDRSSVRVRFDSTYHFPTEIVVDESPGVVDDEWQLRVRSFHSAL